MTLITEQLSEVTNSHGTTALKITYDDASLAVSRIFVVGARDAAAQYTIQVLAIDQSSVIVDGGVRGPNQDLDISAVVLGMRHITHRGADRLVPNFYIRFDTRAGAGSKAQTVH